MKYLFVTYQFFREYWPAIQLAVVLTVQAWSLTLGVLAIELAKRWREAAQKPAEAIN